MNIYDFKKIEKCFICGNIDKNLGKFIDNVTKNLPKFTKVEHPKELERQERLKKRERERERDRGRQRGMNAAYSLADELRESYMKKMCPSHNNSDYANSVIIVSGNCSIGSKSVDYYNEIFSPLDKILADNNCYILFVRGNNDNPMLFHNNEINFKHIKTIQDYSVVLLKNFNCLCVGGSISFDKEWKLSQEKILGRKLYWEGEQPYYDQTELDEILSKYKIGCVVSSTSPSFTFPGTNSFNRTKWARNNSEIKTEFSKERKTLDKIYNKIIEYDAKPYLWFYGRFKQHSEAKMNDIVFISLSQYECMSVNQLIENHFLIDLSKKLEENTYSLDSMDVTAPRNTLRGSAQRGIYEMPRYNPNPIMENPLREDIDADEDEEYVEEADNNDAVENDVQEAGPRLENIARFEVNHNVDFNVNTLDPAIWLRQ